MKNKNKLTTIIKTSPEVLPSKVPLLGVFDFQLKKMITEVLLVLPLFLIMFSICWRLRPVIKAMGDVENMLNNDDFLETLLIHQGKVPSNIKNESA